ncbi:hydroxymyristoyl-ACP dehydratase [Treponema sp.]|uniref:ApeI family dehydratase n=1 Tax=Treponema sp. TaxID=166 RepID=UPI00388F6745
MSSHSIENETVISKDDSSVMLEFVVPKESDFFDGHFPQFKLLPAVGQFELISRFSKKYFHVSRGISSIKRMKFSAPILPDAKVRMKLDFNAEKNSVAFKLWSSADEAKVYSSGVFAAVKS